MFHVLSEGEITIKVMFMYFKEIENIFIKWTGALELRAAVKISGKVILQLRAERPLPLCSFFPLPPRARRRARRLHWRSVQDRAAL